MTNYSLEQLKEKVEILAGTRSPERTGAAVRIGDLDGLISMVTTMKSAKANGTTPTKAEYDALVSDLQVVFQAIIALQSALLERLQP